MFPHMWEFIPESVEKKFVVFEYKMKTQFSVVACMCTRTYIYTHTYTYTHAHTHIRTHIHTYTQHTHQKKKKKTFKHSNYLGVKSIVSMGIELGNMKKIIFCKNKKISKNPDNLYFYIEILCSAIHALTSYDFVKYGVKFSAGFSNFLTHTFYLDITCGIHHDNFLFYHLVTLQ